jgi:NmrA-like family
VRRVAVFAFWESESSRPTAVASSPGRRPPAGPALTSRCRPPPWLGRAEHRGRANRGLSTKMTTAATDRPREHRPRRPRSRSTTPAIAGCSLPRQRAEDLRARLRYDLSSQACPWREWTTAMAQHNARIIAVVGATGLQGGAVTRRLLQDHWPVRALTRYPDRKKARAIAQLGAGVVKADRSDPMSLERAFDGVHGVFSVQNHHISGYQGRCGRESTSPRWASGWASPSSSTAELVQASGAAALGLGRPRLRWRRASGPSICPRRSSTRRRSWS